MKEKFEITTLVVLLDGTEKELKIIYQEGVLEFYLDNKMVFSGDWHANFYEIFRRFIKTID